MTPCGTRRICIAASATAIASLLATATIVRAADPPAPVTMLRSADPGLWLVHVGAETDAASQLPVVHVLYTDRVDVAAGVRYWRDRPSLLGQLEFAAARADGLTLHFADGATTLVTPRGTLPSARLPADFDLLAVGGDVVQSATYALVHRRPNLLRRPAPASAPIQLSGDYGILQLKGAAWSLMADLPRDIARGESIGLSGRDGRVLLTWIERNLRDEGRAAPPESDGDAAASAPTPVAHLRLIEWSDKRWSEPVTVASASGLRRAWIGWNDASAAALIAADAETGDSAALNARLLARDAAAWTDHGLLMGDSGAPLTITTAWEFTALRGLWVVGRPTEDHQFEVGVAPMQSGATVRWSASQSRPRAPVTQWTSWVSTMAICAMLAFLITLRPERLSTPPRLPPHLAPALPARRVLSTLLDLAPALLATAYWWGPMVKNLDIIARETPPEELALAAPLWQQARQGWLLVLAAYALYCFAWEALLRTTPGKYLGGYRVLHENGGRVSLGQLAIRNGMRVAELLDPFVATCSLFVMLVLSQRRQRIGDLLARTMVVGPLPPGAVPPRPGAEPPAAPPGAAT